ALLIWLSTSWPNRSATASCTVRLLQTAVRNASHFPHQSGLCVPCQQVTHNVFLPFEILLEHLWVLAHVLGDRHEELLIPFVAPLNEVFLQLGVDKQEHRLSVRVLNREVLVGHFSHLLVFRTRDDSPVVGQFG